MYKILDLFSGAGGFSYGISQNKEFDAVVALDFNKEAIETYKKNHKDATTFVGNIIDKKVKQEVVKESIKKGVNMIIGGPPCQGFSMKGKKRGLKDPRNFLFIEFFNIVNQIQPEIFIMENVSAMINSSNGFFIKEIVRKFKSIGYEINYNILNSADFGVPQIRKRAFIIGSKKMVFEMPKPTHKIMTTVEDAISDLAYLESGDIEYKRNYERNPMSKYQELMRKDSEFLYNHSATKHSNETLYKLSLIPEKGTKLDLPIHLRTNQKFKTTWSRLHWEEPSPTIDTRFDTPSNGKNTHPILHRAITQREAARIQSFPDKFVFLGHKSSICKQIGNAVPPLLAKALGRSIIKQQNNVVTENVNGTKIYNGDSYKLFGEFRDNQFHAIITDPPYNISKKNNFSTMNQKRRGVDFGEWDKKFDLYSWIEHYYPKLKPGGSFIIFGSFLYISHIADKLTEVGAEVKDVLKWIKTNPMPRNINRRYVLDTEFAIWAVKPKGKWIFNNPSGKPYLRAEFSTSTVSGKERTEHPTQKSLRLMKDIIEIHTNPDDLILDPFMGSGTTGVAARLTDRKFIGIEKEKKYFNISKERISNGK